MKACRFHDRSFFCGRRCGRAQLAGCGTYCCSTQAHRLNWFALCNWYYGYEAASFLYHTCRGNVLKFGDRYSMRAHTSKLEQIN